MRMLRTGIDLQILEDSFAQTGLGKHTFNRFFDHERRFLRQIVGGRSETLASRETGVARVDLVGHLVARELHLVRVDDDDIITAIDVGRVAGLVLASEDLRDLRCKTSQYLVRRVDHHPLFGRGRGVGRDSLVA